MRRERIVAVTRGGRRSRTREDCSSIGPIQE